MLKGKNVCLTIFGHLMSVNSRSDHKSNFPLYHIPMSSLCLFGRK